VNAVFAGFVAGGGDHAALIGTAADDYWFAAKIGAIEKLDGDEEGVHVHVENVRDGGRREIVCVYMERAKSSQVGHEVSLRFGVRIDNGGSFRGDDAGDSGEVVGDTDVGPESCIKKRMNGGKGIVAEFEDEKAAGFETRGGLRDETCVKFVAFFAAVKGECGFVVADFAGEGERFATADVGGIGGDEVEEVEEVEEYQPFRNA
jgi:hypothetical protein